MNDIIFKKQLHLLRRLKDYLCGNGFLMGFKILTDKLLDNYTKVVIESPLDKIDKIQKFEMPVDYFEFYKSVSTVYSSKIEGEDIDFDSYFKHKFLNVKFKPDYTRKVDDLYAAYDFIDNNNLTLENVKKAHSILSRNILPKSQQGAIRNNPMFVINSDDKIEYVAASPEIIKTDLDNLFHDIDLLQRADLNPFEIFYYASLLHLVFVKIHPFQDGNGRTARLLEKWFLIVKIGQKATSVQLEKNYYKRLKDYYSNIRKIGLEYENLDYLRCLDFLLMTVQGIDDQG
ncbi:MAG: Fic family protein [Saprospiraceae bacterium]